MPETACTVVSKKFGYGSVYTISLDYVSCHCCWMDNIELQ